MAFFDSIKLEIQAIDVVEPGNSRYGLFLDQLSRQRITNGEEDEAHDLWFFSFNTDFCRDSAKHYARIIQQFMHLYNNLSLDKSNIWWFLGQIPAEKPPYVAVMPNFV